MFLWTNLSGLQQPDKRELFDPFATKADVGGPDQPGLNATQHVSGWPEVVASAYHGFLRKLDSLDQARAFGAVSCPVFAAGYDWRKSNRDSGDDLGQKILGILQFRHGKQAIVITHSMGGLATRSAIQNTSGLEDKILAVIHVCQPVTGAAVAYRRFYSGMVNNVDATQADMSQRLGFMLILGFLRTQYMSNQASLRGPLELLPTNDYRDTGNKPWLFATNGTTTVPFPGDVFTNYQKVTGPPGLINLQAYANTTTQAGPTDNPPVVANEISAGCSNASRFHEGVGQPPQGGLDLFKHPRTFCIYSTGVVTDMTVTLDVRVQETRLDGPLLLNIAAGRRPDGDGTVPATSASALFPGQRNPPSSPSLSNRQYEVNGVEHGEAMNSSEVQDLIVALLKLILAHP